MWLELTNSNGAKFMLNFDQIIKVEPDLLRAQFAGK